MTTDSQPCVTVSIPTYNRAHLLQDAIESVLNQSLRDVEIFVSDNASTDDTRSAVASFDDPRVHYVRNKSNIGHLANMSRGLRLGSAPFVTILPDDDIMLPGNLERKVALLERQADIGLVHSASLLMHVGAGGDVVEKKTFFTGGTEDAIENAAVVLRRLLADSYWINFPTAVIRRSLIGDAHFDQADGLADDLGMMLRLVRRLDGVGYIADPLVALRMHSGAVSTGAGFHELHGQVFMPTVAAIENIRKARERFLRDYGRELQDVNALRSSSRRWIRYMLLEIVKWRSRPSPSALFNFRLILAAARVEPTVLIAPEGRSLVRRALRLSVRSAVGSPGRTLYRRIHGRSRA
jgi:cellulose synthase/poly-beta-1,6-N-acetylglucosamine synthase-like glycosyltransferase